LSSKAAFWTFPARYVAIVRRVNTTESTLAMAAVVFSREVFVGTVPILAGQQMARVTVRWIKSIGTSVDHAA